jgi:phosphoserine phosphatase
MNTIVTLIGRKERPLTLHDVEAFEQAMAGHDLAPLRRDWLCEGEACDIHADLAGEDSGLSEWSGGVAETLGLDAIAQPVEGRRKKALFADMESTIIREEMLENLAEYVGLREQVAEITRRAMNGEIASFRDALAARLALLKGTPAEVIDDMAARMTLSDGARELVATMREHGSHCVLVTGGFGVFTRIIAADLGFHAEYSNILDVKDGKLTGEVVEPVQDKDGKLKVLREVSAARGLSPVETCAVGDGANDLPMILAAGLGVAWRAKPHVQNRARHNIRFAGLRALLWAQGYRREDVREGVFQA